MYSNRNWLPLFVIVTLAFGCKAEPAAEEGATEATVAVDAAAIEDAIDAANAQFETAVAANDTIAIANLYAEDAIVLPPNMTRGEGRDAVRGVFASLLAPSPNPTLTLTSDKVIVAESGELATEIGTFAISGTAPDGTEWQDSGKNIRVWKNVNGTWQIVADAWNSDTPMPGAMQAEGGV
jgi:uncharacterized protein (TIGR02246 family)